jgi:hypothetical protein
VLSLPTPPKCRAASVRASLHAAFARNVRAQPSGCSTFKAIWVHLHYGPVTRSPSLKMDSSIGFREGSFLPTLLFKLRGLDSYPGGTLTHWSSQPSLDAHISVLIGSSMSASAIWHLLRGPVSCPEVWLAQCLCESNESLPYRKLVESAKAEEQRIRIRTSQSASIDGENLNTLGLRQLFRLS